MTVMAAIRRANAILPGRPAPDGQTDPRWQAVIAVGEFVEAEPEAVWAFVERWGKHANEDLRSAIATCLLEHLLAVREGVPFVVAMRSPKDSEDTVVMSHEKRRPKGVELDAEGLTVSWSRRFLACARCCCSTLVLGAPAEPSAGIRAGQRGGLPESRLAVGEAQSPRCETRVASSGRGVSAVRP
jgi:hypothetical protein